MGYHLPPFIDDFMYVSARVWIGEDISRFWNCFLLMMWPFNIFFTSAILPLNFMTKDGGKDLNASFVGASIVIGPGMAEVEKWTCYKGRLNP